MHDLFDLQGRKPSSRRNRRSPEAGGRPLSPRRRPRGSSRDAARRALGKAPAVKGIADASVPRCSCPTRRTITSASSSARHITAKWGPVRRHIKRRTRTYPPRFQTNNPSSPIQSPHWPYLQYHPSYTQIRPSTSKEPNSFLPTRTHRLSSHFTPSPKPPLPPSPSFHIPSASSMEQLQFQAATIPPLPWQQARGRGGGGGGGGGGGRIAPGGDFLQAAARAGERVVSISTSSRAPCFRCRSSARRC